MSTRTDAELDRRIAHMDPEQLPAGKHQLHSPGHFAGLYASENVAGTEFVFGATFVILGASMVDVLIGLAVGNLLAVLSYRFITAPIATRTRVSVYTFLNRVVGGAMTKVYNGVNAVIFAIISAAMITVSATALRHVFGFPEQTEAYPTHLGFVVIAVVFGCVAVLVAAFGFNALAEFASICGPWLMVMFATGGIVLLPRVAESVTGSTDVGSWQDFLHIGGSAIFTGRTPDGAAGITLLGIIGYSWAANSFAHFGMVDMSLFRYAKKDWYGYLSSTGMMLGHYMAWVSAGFMGAATAAIIGSSITVVEPGEVSYQALGYAGFATVIVGGWTTANANLYRAGLAGQAIFPRLSRQLVTLLVGLIVAVASAFPFIYRGYLNLVTYAGIVLVPVGGVLFAEYYLLPRFGMTRYWARYKGVQNMPALVAWGVAILVCGLAAGFGLMPIYFTFLPAWAIAVVVYVLLARVSGARGDYSEGQAEDRLFQQRVDAYHDRLAAHMPDAEAATDRRPLTRALRWGWILTLVVVSVDALVVFFASHDMAGYERLRDQFFWIAGLGTLLYFVLAYWELRRRKAVVLAAVDAAGERPAAREGATARSS